MSDDPTPRDGDGERDAGEPPEAADDATEDPDGDGSGRPGAGDEASGGEVGMDEVDGGEVGVDEVDGGEVGVDEVDGGGAAADGSDTTVDAAGTGGGVPADVRKYERFKKVDGAQYDRVNDFLRERTYVTAREWAIARLCADFRTETGVEMTKIGENLDVLVPFMEDTYSPQAVNQARSSFEEKVRKAGATFLYGAMCDFFTAEELDELMYEVTEVAKFLLEVEGVDLAVEEELEAEDRISGVMREVRAASEALRYEECPHCGEPLDE